MDNNIDIARNIVEQCENKSINLCSTFDDWTKVCMALSAIGESGRGLFHRLARIDAKYKERENDLKFSNCLRTTQKVSFGSLMYMAECAGIEINKEKHLFRFGTGETHRNRVKHQEPQKPLCTIPFEYVERSASYNSQFVYFLCGLFDKGKLESPTIERLVSDYALGATKDGCIIFWQIDINGKVREGKIMRYNGDTGKRIDVFPNTPVYWVSKAMKKKEMLPQDWERTQCLFGEHLLHYPSNKDKVVALVESEKNALIGAALYPNYVWVSCGNCQGFKGDMLNPLQGRTVIAFPDTGMFDKWKEKASVFSFAKILVSDILEGRGLPNNYDIADWLIEAISSGETLQVAEIKKELSDAERTLLAMQEKNPALTLLIEKLGLELVG